MAAAYTATYANEGLTSHQVYQGAILWLPPLSDVINHRVQKRIPKASCGSGGVKAIAGRYRPVNAGMFDHPILVLSRTATAPKKIDFLLMTTFRNNPLGIASKPQHDQANYLPVKPSQRHPESDALLKCKYGLFDIHTGNVDLSTVFTMDWRDAQSFYNSHPGSKDPWSLNDASFRMALHGVQARIPQGQRPYHSGQPYRFFLPEWWEWQRSVLRLRAEQIQGRVLMVVGYVRMLLQAVGPATAGLVVMYLGLYLCLCGLEILLPWLLAWVVYLRETFDDSFRSVYCQLVGNV